MKLEEFRGSPTMWEFKLKGTICHVRAFFQENATKKKKKNLCCNHPCMGICAKRTTHT